MKGRRGAGWKSSICEELVIFDPTVFSVVKGMDGGRGGGGLMICNHTVFSVVRGMDEGMGLEELHLLGTCDMQSYSVLSKNFVVSSICCMK